LYSVVSAEGGSLHRAWRFVGARNVVTAAEDAALVVVMVKLGAAKMGQATLIAAQMGDKDGLPPMR